MNKKLLRDTDHTCDLETRFNSGYHAGVSWTVGLRELLNRSDVKFLPFCQNSICFR